MTDDYKTSDYCAVCGESPDAGSHLPHGHAYVPPIYPTELVDRVASVLPVDHSVCSASDLRSWATTVIAEVRRLPQPTTRFGDLDSCAALGDAADEHGRYKSAHKAFGHDTMIALRCAAMAYAADELERLGAPASAQLARDIAVALRSEP